VLPSAAFDLEPAWTNFLENAGLVQFNHRLLGYVLFLLGLLAWLRSRASALEHVRGAFAAMMAILVVQIALGIVTVMQGAPWQLAILHQLGAVALFALAIRARFAALYPRAQRIAHA
jgi:cytochrome c oxidase assembly protein subunit 15